MRLSAHWMLGAAVIAAPLAVPLAAQTLVQTGAREVVDAAPPSDLSVTIYRDPDRAADAPLRRNNPQGLAMISETRRVTIPKGESTIRFEGVAEGMIGVSAIVTGLPGGTIEKNRNAELLSPAALVNGTLGNRVTITRTNPATGEAKAEQAIVRTRADGGLVLETSRGLEAVRCAGLPEKLTFERIPAGLSASPVFSVDTRSDAGGTYDVTLTYLAWGFDWQANYVATLLEKPAGKAAGGEFPLHLLSWLTLVNDNGQSFDKAKLQIIAGRLNVESDYEGLADPPTAEPLRLSCYPFGSTAQGSQIVEPMPPPPPMEVMYAPAAAPQMMMRAESVGFTGSRMKVSDVMTAREENLGDLKLFRVPERVDVSAKGMKQVAFLNKDAVKARYLYQAACEPYAWFDDQSRPPTPASLLLVTKNEEAKGLGIALPQGSMTIYEPTPDSLGRGDQLAGKTSLRDYARGQDMELELGGSRQVFSRCAAVGIGGSPRKAVDTRQWTAMRAELTNANPHAITLRLQLGWAGQREIRFPGKKLVVKNGYQTVEVTVPANQTRSFDWQLRETGG